MFNPSFFECRSQDLEMAYHDAAQFYWGKPDAWIKKSKIFTPNSIPIILPNFRVHDIDTEEDWLRAELMFKCLLSLGIKDLG